MSITKFINNKFVKNMGWIVGAQIVQMLISMIVSVLSARYLGPSQFGTLNYTASFVTFCTSFATLGMEGVFIKKIIADPSGEGAYLGGCMMLRLISSVLSCFGILAIIYILNPGDELKLLLAGLQSIELIFLSLHLFDSWFQRYLNSKYVSIARMTASLLVAVFRIYLLVTSKSIVWFALTTTLTNAIIAVMLYIFYLKTGKCKLKADFKRGFETLKESYHFIISGIAVAIYGQMDKIMIGQMMTDSMVGLYATATAVCTMWIFVPNAIINSARPIIMKYKNDNDEKMYLLRLKQMYSGIIWFCILTSVLISILAPFIITILYGEAFSGAVGVLRIYIWSEMFSMIGTARSVWIVSENYNKYVKYYLIMGAVVNLILNTLFIPVAGMSGAAVATVITQFFTAIISPMFFKETRIHTSYVIDAFIFKWLKSNKGL